MTKDNFGYIIVYRDSGSDEYKPLWLNKDGKNYISSYTFNCFQVIYRTRPDAVSAVKSATRDRANRYDHLRILRINLNEQIKVKVSPKGVRNQEVEDYDEIEF